jgi:hypothetical protein
MPLLPLGDVRELLPQVGDAYGDDQLLVAMGLVAGWLRTATGLTVLPTQIPLEHDLYAPALELLALLVSNPENLERSESGRGVRWWSRSPRRDHILAQLRARYRGGPSGCFPPPRRWPDPDRLYVNRWDSVPMNERW